MNDEYEADARRITREISERQTQLRELASMRPPLTLKDVCPDRCNFADRTVEREVQSFMNRYDSVYVPGLAKANDDTDEFEMWELVAGGSERYVVTDGADDTWWVLDTDTGMKEGPDSDAADAADDAARRNRDDTLENLAGFPFAQNHGYEIDKYDVDAFAAAGFLVYLYAGDRYIAGIDGGGYSFTGAHYLPVYWAKAVAGGWLIETETGPRRCADSGDVDVPAHGWTLDEPGEHAESLRSLRAETLADLAARVGDDGTGDLGVIVDHAPPGTSVDVLVGIVRDAREGDDPVETETGPRRCA